MTKPLIKTENLTRLYKNHRGWEMFGLKNINIIIQQGECVSIMGPSGAGKTTLFNLLGLLDRPNYGFIYFNNNDLGLLTSNEKARFRNQHIGLIFQHFHLIPNLTAYENARIPLLLREGKPYREYREGRERVEILFRQFEMFEKKQRFPNELSGGEQQRVAIIRALVNDPELILADEPTGNLDSQNAEKVLTLLLELNRGQGRTVVFITHNRGLALKAQRIIYLKDGELYLD